MHPDEQFPHDDWESEAKPGGETPSEFNQRLMGVATENCVFLVGKVKNAGEMKTVQLMALAQSVAMSDRPTEDALNSIELFLNLVRKFREGRKQSQIVAALDQAMEIGPSALTPR